ncbi:DMT family transporter [Metabacillus indicus]|uniref:DMT family transporter n=1 Tax=Metabacillus indicus TaxID=246786 RepID=UPI003983EA29
MNNTRIYLILVGVMLIWGLNVPLLKIIVDSFMPVTVTSVRIFTASICVLIILAFLKLLRKPTLKETFYIAAGGLLNVVCHHYFLSVGLTMTSSTNGGLILGLGPMLTAILSIIFLNQRLTVIRLTGFILGLTGVGFTILAGSKGVSSMNTGDIYIFISIFTQACSFIIIKKACRTLDPRLMTGYMLFFGSFVLFLISLVTEPGGLASLTEGTPEVWGVFFTSAILATAIGHMTYNYAIGMVGPAETSIFMNLSTFFALAGSALILHEAVYASHLFGLLFIVSGVILGSGAYEEFRHRHHKHEASSSG